MECDSYRRTPSFCNPIASTIFILIIQILRQNIRENNEIIEITIEDIEIKSIQFADDMNLFSLYDLNSRNNAISTLTTFKVNTGLKLNYDKLMCIELFQLNTQMQCYTQQEL